MQANKVNFQVAYYSVGKLSMDGNVDFFAGTI